MNNNDTHRSILTNQNLIYTELKTGSKERPETDEDGDDKISYGLNEPNIKDSQSL